MTHANTHAPARGARVISRCIEGVLAIGFFVGGYFLLAGVHGGPSQHGRTQTADAAMPASKYAPAETNVTLVDGVLDTDEVDVSSKLPGRLLRLAVKEGDFVHAGQVVAVLEAEELDAKQEQADAGVRAAEVQVSQGEIAVDLERRKAEDQVVQAEAGVHAAQATLGMARAKLQALENGARPQEIAQAEAGVQAAKAALGMANAKLSALREGARPQEVTQAAQAVSAAQAAYDTAKKTYTRVKNLADEGVVAQQKADEAEMTYRSADAQLSAAQAKLDLVKEGARRQEVEAASEQVQQAKAALEVAQQTLSIAREGSRKEERIAAREQVKQAEMGVTAAQQAWQLAKDARLVTQLRQQDVVAARLKVAAGRGQLHEVSAYRNQTRIVCPIAGRVTQRMSRAGEIVAPGYAILSVARTDAYWVDVYLDESQFRGHHVNDTVQVQVPALGDTLPGHIARVLPAADFATKRATNEKGTFDARAIQLRITLDRPVRELASGMTARVAFPHKP